MKRWLIPVIGAIVVVIPATAIHYVSKAEALKKREAAYQSTLQAYSKDLRPGLTRKNVEDYFRTKNISFAQMCCVEGRSAFADLVKVGQEDAPWYRGENYVYVAFEFVNVEPDPPLIPWMPHDSDLLTKASIFRQLLDCL
ncbi:MAG: hypothetical protein ACRD4P_09840 [Bryobacteraceae bacterium]